MRVDWEISLASPECEPLESGGLEEVVRATTAWMSGFLAHVMAINLVKRCPFLDTSPASITYVVRLDRESIQQKNLVVGVQE